jgi:hypothetical protein
MPTQPKPLTALGVFARRDGRGTNWLCQQLQEQHGMTVKPNRMTNYQRLHPDKPWRMYRECPPEILKALDDILSDRAVKGRIRQAARAAKKGQVSRPTPRPTKRQWVGLEKALAQLTSPLTTSRETTPYERTTYTVEPTPQNAGSE